MLEYGAAVIILPIKRFYDFLPTRTADSQQEWKAGPQQKDDSQSESAIETDRMAEIRFEQVRMGKNSDFDEEIKGIKQEMMEMKIKMDSNATMTLQIKEMLLNGRKHSITSHNQWKIK